VAARWGRKEIVRLLPEEQADIDAVDKIRNKTLLWATKSRHKEVVRHLLRTRATLAHLIIMDKTALRLVASLGDAMVVQLLVKEGADVGATDDHGNTASMLAEEKGHYKVMHLLVDNQGHRAIRPAYSADGDDRRQSKYTSPSDTTEAEKDTAQASPTAAHSAGKGKNSGTNTTEGATGPGPSPPANPPDNTPTNNQSGPMVAFKEIIPPMPQLAIYLLLIRITTFCRVCQYRHVRPLVTDQTIRLIAQKRESLLIIMREKRNQKAQEMEAYLSSIENATDAQISYGGWRHYRPTGYNLGVDGVIAELDSFNPKSRFGYSVIDFYFIDRMISRDVLLILVVLESITIMRFFIGLSILVAI
jgi:hypothetical protein